MTRWPRTLARLAVGCAAGLCLAACTYLGAKPHTGPVTSAPSAGQALEATGQEILDDSLDALLEASDVKVSAQGSEDGVPFSYEVSGDYDSINSQYFEMHDGKGHVEWLAEGLAEGETPTYYVKANQWHGDLIEPTDHVDYLEALREDRWLLLPKSEVASMILASDEIDDLFDFLEASADNEQMKYQGIHDLDGVPAHRFASPEATLWLSTDASPLPLRLETVGYAPYTRMTSTYRDWNVEIQHDLPAEGEYATVPEITSRKA